MGLGRGRARVAAIVLHGHAREPHRRHATKTETLPHERRRGGGWRCPASRGLSRLVEKSVLLRRSVWEVWASLVKRGLVRHEAGPPKRERSRAGTADVLTAVCQHQAGQNGKGAESVAASALLRVGAAAHLRGQQRQAR
eukprot:366399-Chlamydomonas_euryale.AAC.34